MPGQEPPDRRRSVRRPIELKVEYKRLNTFFADYTKNISRGGTFIKTSRPLPVGTEFLFKLFIPGREVPFTIHGEVQGVVADRPGAATAAGRSPEPPEGAGGVAAELGEGDASSGGPEPGMAIRFVYREGDPQDEIAQAVERLMSESLGVRLYARLMEHANKRQG